MPGQSSSSWQHPKLTRRDLLTAGSLGLLGLSLADVHGLQAAETRSGPKSVIYIFLSGGLAQHESFDPKPDAPDNIRGEFEPIRTRTPGLIVSEHLPKLAGISQKWAVVRSMTHPSNSHSEGHHMMLTGTTPLPIGFSPVRPQSSDYPSIASLAGNLIPGRNHLPSAAMLPFHYIHHSGRVIAGQFAGQLGAKNDPWIISASHNCPGYGACPNCIDHQLRPHQHQGNPVFQPPNLRLPEGLDLNRLEDRRGLLNSIDHSRTQVEAWASQTTMDQYRASAWSLLTSSRVRSAFDLGQEPDRVRDAYGQNLFGYSCLLARRLVEVGVRMVQVNLGRNETWDTHGNAFPHLKNNLLPPTDQCVSALIEDLDSRGLLQDTLIVMAGEFGRTPRISTLSQFYKGPGRDHWGAVQSVFFAGGGVRGGTAIGESDRYGGNPKSAPQRPENLAATIFQTLGIDPHAMWYDTLQRPHHVYRGEPISGLTA